MEMQLLKPSSRSKPIRLLFVFKTNKYILNQIWEIFDPKLWWFNVTINREHSGSNLSDLIKKYDSFAFADEQKSYGFGTIWGRVKDYRI